MADERAVKSEGRAASAEDERASEREQAGERESEREAGQRAS